MLTQKQARKLKRLIRAAEKAAIDDSWGGSREPEEARDRAVLAILAKKELRSYIKILTAIDIQLNCQ